MKSDPSRAIVFEKDAEETEDEEGVESLRLKQQTEGDVIETNAESRYQQQQQQQHEDDREEPATERQTMQHSNGEGDGERGHEPQHAKEEDNTLQRAREKLRKDPSWADGGHTLKKTSSNENELRREAVKNAFLHAWRSYER